MEITEHINIDPAIVFRMDRLSSAPKLRETITANPAFIPNPKFMMKL